MITSRVKSPPHSPPSKKHFKRVKHTVTSNGSYLEPEKAIIVCLLMAICFLLGARFCETPAIFSDQPHNMHVEGMSARSSMMMVPPVVKVSNNIGNSSEEKAQENKIVPGSGAHLPNYSKRLVDASDIVIGKLNADTTEVNHMSSADTTEVKDTSMSSIMNTGRSLTSESTNTTSIFDHSDVEPGDCRPIGRRRPKWDRRGAIIRALPEFAKVYDGRPYRENGGGMRFSHSFGVWYTLRALRPEPTVVIECGAQGGHSTWLIQQALPRARVITISPNTPKKTFAGVKYYTGRAFKDFNEIDWSMEGIDIDGTVILFDDHQSVYRRVFQEALKFGFKRFIIDDNCEFQQCDALSLKWMCEVTREKEWMGFIRDNFGKIEVAQTWEEHMRQATELNRLKTYYEFPPVIRDRKGVKALLKDQHELDRMVGPISKNWSEFRSYAFMAYAEA